MDGGIPDETLVVTGIAAAGKEPAERGKRLSSPRGGLTVCPCPPNSGMFECDKSNPPVDPMILSFADADTEQLFREEKNRRFAAIARVALRKLIQMNRAGRLSDLAVPPGNRLEPLRGTLDGFYSIRINDQWRILFRWTDRGPAEVSITDYH